MPVLRSSFPLALALWMLSATGIAAAEPARAVKVTVLSTMLAGNRGAGIGEWGFAALLEVDGQRLLIDTGERPETVLRNAFELGIDLSDVSDVVLTHNHGDHTAGLLTLRRELAKKNPQALPPAGSSLNMKAQRSFFLRSGRGHSPGGLVHRRRHGPGIDSDQWLWAHGNHQHDRVLEKDCPRGPAAYIEAVYRLRSLLGLTRRVVGAVGSSFTLDKGIDALALAS